MKFMPYIFKTPKFVRFLLSKNHEKERKKIVKNTNIKKTEIMNQKRTFMGVKNFSLLQIEEKIIQNTTSTTSECYPFV